jgi:hypothetical protein
MLPPFSWSCMFLTLAVQLDVDLSKGAQVGAVQLELWAGATTPLLSAPFLLLPPDAANTADALLLELQTFVQACGWVTPDDADASQAAHGSQPQVGTAAWLEDLGQVLYTAECIQKLDNGRAAHVAVASEPDSDLPSSWGGISAAAMADQHTSNPALLSSTLALGEGLLEYAKSEGLAHTSALLSSCICKLQARQEALAGAAGPGHNSAVQGSSQGDIAEAGGVRKRLVKKLEQEAGTEGHSSDVGTSAPQRPVAPAARARSPAASTSSQQQPFSYTQTARCTLLGFSAPGQEQQYQLWLAARYNRVVAIQGVLVVLWALASLVRMAQDGASAFLSHLPLHLACGLPYAASALLALYKQHR